MSDPSSKDRKYSTTHWNGLSLSLSLVVKFKRWTGRRGAGGSCGNSGTRGLAAGNDDDEEEEEEEDDDDDEDEDEAKALTAVAIAPLDPPAPWSCTPIAASLARSSSLVPEGKVHILTSGSHLRPWIDRKMSIASRRKPSLAPKRSPPSSARSTTVATDLLIAFLLQRSVSPLEQKNKMR